MSLEDNVFQRALNGVVPIADGAGITLDARGCPVITFITGNTCTLTYSRVDSPSATSHTASEVTENGDTVTENTRLSLTVDWPYYRVSAAGGAARVWVG